MVYLDTPDAVYAYMHGVASRYPSARLGNNPLSSVITIRFWIKEYFHFDDLNSFENCKLDWQTLKPMLCAWDDFCIEHLPKNNKKSIQGELFE